VFKKSHNLTAMFDVREASQIRNFLRTQKHSSIMPTLLWIIIFGLLMSLIALTGGILLFLRPAIADCMILPLVAFSAGSLMGGALFHMIPHAVEKMGNQTQVYAWLMLGFVLFLGLEQFLNWHHSHTHSHATKPFGAANQGHEPCPNEKSCMTYGEIHTDSALTSDLEAGFSSQIDKVSSREEAQGDEVSMAVALSETQQENKRSLGYLILFADAVHNFIGGLFVGASFVNSPSLGLSAWMAAAFHELPQELGDFAILVHGGWTKKNALLYNFLSALTFPLGGIIAYASSKSMDISFLIPFAAGNFLYIGASDLIPEIKHHHGIKSNLLHYCSFLVGAAIQLAIRIALDGF
jgi:zinc transporter ZupT